MFHRPMRFPFRAILFACALFGASPRAAADDPGASLKAQARALFDEARKLAGEAKYPEACPKLEESQRLDPGIGTEFYLAECYEHTGRFASAWALYLQVVDETGEAKMKERMEYAQKRADALQPKLTRMVVNLPDSVKAIPGIEIRRNGTVLKTGQWGSAVPVDAGKYSVSASAPSKKTWETTVEASGEGATVTVTIPALEDQAPAVPTATAAAFATSMAPAPSALLSQEPGSTWPVQKRVAVVTGGVAIAGLLAGAITGGLAAGKKGEMDRECTTSNPPACNPKGIAIANDVKAFGTASTAGFIAGGILAAASVVVWITTPKPEGPKAKSALGTRFAVTSTGIVLQGAW